MVDAIALLADSTMMMIVSRMMLIMMVAKMMMMVTLRPHLPHPAFHPNTVSERRSFPACGRFTLTP